MTNIHELNLTPLTEDTAAPRIRTIFAETSAAYGFVPNLYCRLGILPPLLETYLAGYSGFRGQAGFTPAEQELVFLVISVGNDCGYCVAAHSMVADTMSKLPAEVTAAIRSGRSIPDEKLAALAAFTRVMLLTCGRPTPADAKAFLDAKYTETHILGILLALAVKTISNYANHLFRTPLDAAFASHAWPIK